MFCGRRARVAAAAALVALAAWPACVRGLNPGKAFTQHGMMGGSTDVGLLQASVDSIAQMRARDLWGGTEQGPPWYRTKTAGCVWVLVAALGVWAAMELRTWSLLRHRRKLALLVAERTAQLREEKVALTTAQKDLELQATHDALTGVWNRAAVLEHMEREVARARREGVVLAVAIADLDHFRQIHDTCGNLCGDRVLREAAQRLSFCLREYDSIGRYGEEQFLILMPGYDPVESEGRLEELVVSVHENAFLDNGREIRTSASFGATVFRPQTRLLSIEELLAAADEALYRAKEAGRNCAHFTEVVERGGVPGRR